jgi:hypothetical protein
MMHLFKTKGRKACFPQGLNQWPGCRRTLKT